MTFKASKVVYRATKIFLLFNLIFMHHLFVATTNQIRSMPSYKIQQDPKTQFFIQEFPTQVSAYITPQEYISIISTANTCIFQLNRTAFWTRLISVTTLLISILVLTLICLLTLTLNTVNLVVISIFCISAFCFFCTVLSALWYWSHRKQQRIINQLKQHLEMENLEIFASRGMEFQLKMEHVNARKRTMCLELIIDSDIEKQSETVVCSETYQLGQK